MPVTIDSYSSVVSVPPGGNITVNMNIPRTGMLAVALLGGGNVYHQVPKYNGAGGADMTLVVAKDDVQCEAYMYMYANPAVGTIPFYFAEAGGQQLIRAQMVILDGVDLNTPVAGSQSWNANPVDYISFIVTHAYKAGQLGLACGGNAYTNGGFVNGTIIQLGNSTNSWHGYVSNIEADGTTAFTLDTGGGNRYCAVGAVFNPKPAAAGSQAFWWW